MLKGMEWRSLWIKLIDFRPITWLNLTNSTSYCLAGNGRMDVITSPSDRTGRKGRLPLKTLHVDDAASPGQILPVLETPRPHPASPSSSPPACYPSKWGRASLLLKEQAIPLLGKLRCWGKGGVLPCL